MNLFSPGELTANCAESGSGKAVMPLARMVPLAVLAGILIAFGGAVTNTAVYSLDNVSVSRVVCGLLFPFGLAMVVLTGAELFTGNSLMVISVLNGQARLSRILRNWLVVYLGNFAGALLVAAGCAFFGQMDYSGGALAVFTIKLAAAKCVMPVGDAVVKGIFCNLLVCLGVLLSMSAKDTIGKIAGAYIPVAYFVFCGFEHCIANLYYVPAGLFALRSYAAAAAAAGVDTSALTWGGFLLHNLLPVTIGNILGGGLIGVLMWFAYLRKSEKRSPA